MCHTKCVYVCIWHICLHTQSLSCVQLSATPRIVAHQAPVSMGFQAKLLEWVAVPFSRRSSSPRARTHFSCIGKWILYHWITWEAYKCVCVCVCVCARVCVCVEGERDRKREIKVSFTFQKKHSFSLQWGWLSGFIKFTYYTSKLIFFSLLAMHVACRILVPQPGVKPVAPAVEAESPNYWITREVL